MKIIKTVTRKVEITEKVICDKCNEQIKTGAYDAFCCDIELKTGTSYPEGGSGDKIRIDLCPECAGKLFEKLEKDGYRLNKSEWDY